MQSISADESRYSFPLRAFEAAGGDLRFDEATSRLVLVSPPEAWAYAAVASLEQVPVGEGPVLIRVRAFVTKGYVGFGILNKEQSDFLVEEGVRAEEGACEITLSLAAIEEAGLLVVRNWAGGGNTSQAEIESVIVDKRPVPEADRARGHLRFRARTLSEYWFCRYLEREIPELRDASFDDWECVCAIRDWVFAATPRSESKASALEAKYGYAVYDEPVHETFRRLESGEGGFLCAGTAALLAKIYELCGYRAYTYNAGPPDGNDSHVVTVVELKDRKIVLQDAFFNSTFVRGGQPLDVRDLLRLLEQRTPHEAELLQGRNKMKPLVGGAEQIERWIERHGSRYRLGPVLVESSRLVSLMHNLSIATYERIVSIEDWIERQMGERDLRYLYLFPLDTNGGPEAEGLLKLAREAGQRATPMAPGGSRADREQQD